MAENVENLNFAQLRETPAEMAEMRSGIAGVRSENARLRREVEADFKATNMKVDRVSLLLLMPAGHVHGPKTRIERRQKTRGG